jgi:MOSC domain-containing protein YiiM
MNSDAQTSSAGRDFRVTHPARLLAIAIRHRSRGTMLELPRAEVTRSGGVADDVRGRPGRRQVTVLSLEDWQAACAQAGRPELPWTTRRANLLVTGIDLAALERNAGERGLLRIGTVELEVTGETAPCERMDEACPGLRAALAGAGRGGVTCRVRRGGELAAGDPVQRGYPRHAAGVAAARGAAGS